MASVSISPVLSPLDFYNAAIKGKTERLTMFLASKKDAADLGVYLEFVNGSDSCNTPLLLAVRNGHLATVKLLAEAGAKLLVPSARSALCLAMDDTTPNQKMLNLLLHYGANPYIPDATGLTAMEYALTRRSTQTGHHRQADRFGDCLRSFIAAKHALNTKLYMLVPATAGWLGAKPVWKQRQCVLIPRYSEQGLVRDVEMLVFSNQGMTVTALWVTNAGAALQEVSRLPAAQGTSPKSCISLTLPNKQHEQPKHMLAFGSKHSGWRICIGFSSAPSGANWQSCPEMLSFMTHTKPQPDPDKQPLTLATPISLPSTRPLALLNPSPTPPLPLLTQPSSVSPISPATTSAHASSFHDVVSMQHAPVPFTSLASPTAVPGASEQAASPSPTPQAPDTPLTAEGSLLAGASSPISSSASSSAEGVASAPVMTSRSINLPQPAHQLCLRDHCSNLAAQCSAMGVELQLPAQDVATVTGPEQDLPQALALLQSACDRFEHSCVEKVMLLEKHKAAAFTDPAAGATAQLLLQRMQSVGQQRGVLIQMGTASTSSGSKPVFNGVKVHVVRGSLTQQAVTALVNPTNEKLGTHGGVSKHIAQAAGAAELQKQCNAVLAELPAGQQGVPIGSSVITVCSKACRKKLLCEYIIHAVGPHYRGKVQDRQQLASTVQSVLTSAASKGMQTVAMPLIGTGQAGWPKKLAAQVCLAVVSTFVNASPGSVKEVRFVDLNDEAIAALQEAVQAQGQGPAGSLTLLGAAADCAAAMQDMQHHIQDSMVTVRKNLLNFLSKQAREEMLRHAALMPLHCQLSGDCLTLKGCKELVDQAERFVEKRTAEAIDLELGYPLEWTHVADSNTQLFEVDLADPTVAELIKALQDAKATVVKVQRIQNKLLWAAYASNRFAMKGRWQTEPNLPHINGGGPMLWHGTGATDPWLIYAAEHGFMSNHAKLNGLWGCGTYYSTRPRLAMDYQHSVSASDKGVQSGLHTFNASDGLKQLLAVDVLTGKAKELRQNSSLRIAPELEGTQGDIAGLRYDSVYGIHPSEQTPIYITYNTGHAYPKFLITYKR